MTQENRKFTVNKPMAESGIPENASINSSASSPSEAKSFYLNNASKASGGIPRADVDENYDLAFGEKELGESAIASEAYDIWLNTGKTNGHHEYDWKKAKEIISLKNELAEAKRQAKILELRGVSRGDGVDETKPYYPKNVQPEPEISETSSESASKRPQEGILEGTRTQSRINPPEKSEKETSSMKPEDTVSILEKINQEREEGKFKNVAPLDSVREQEVKQAAPNEVKTDQKDGQGTAAVTSEQAKSGLTPEADVIDAKTPEAPVTSTTPVAVESEASPVKENVTPGANNTPKQESDHGKIARDMFKERYRGDAPTETPAPTPGSAQKGTETPVTAPKPEIVNPLSKPDAAAKEAEKPKRSLEKVDAEIEAKVKEEIARINDQRKAKNVKELSDYEKYDIRYDLTKDRYLQELKYKMDYKSRWPLGMPMPRGLNKFGILDEETGERIKGDDGKDAKFDGFWESKPGFINRWNGFIKNWNRLEPKDRPELNEAIVKTINSIPLIEFLRSRIEKMPLTNGQPALPENPPPPPPPAPIPASTETSAVPTNPAQPKLNDFERMGFSTEFRADNTKGLGGKTYEELIQKPVAEMTYEELKRAKDLLLEKFPEEKRYEYSSRAEMAPLGLLGKLEKLPPKTQIEISLARLKMFHTRWEIDEAINNDSSYGPAKKTWQKADDDYEKAYRESKMKSRDEFNATSEGKKLHNEKDKLMEILDETHSVFAASSLGETLYKKFEDANRELERIEKEAKESLIQEENKPTA